MPHITTGRAPWYSEQLAAHVQSAVIAKDMPSVNDRSRIARRAPNPSCEGGELEARDVGIGGTKRW